MYSILFFKLPTLLILYLRQVGKTSQRTQTKQTIMKTHFSNVLLIQYSAEFYASIHTWVMCKLILIWNKGKWKRSCGLLMRDNISCLSWVKTTNGHMQVLCKNIATWHCDMVVLVLRIYLQFPHQVWLLMITSVENSLETMCHAESAKANLNLDDMTLRVIQ